MIPKIVYWFSFYLYGNQIMFLIYMHFGQNELFLLYSYLLMNKYKNPNQSNTINQSIMVKIESMIESMSRPCRPNEIHTTWNSTLARAPWEIKQTERFVLIHRNMGYKTNHVYPATKAQECLSEWTLPSLCLSFMGRGAPV